ncbi:TPA: hypothetical protein ACH3X1_001181 [Trebouxia sp. C0004]
MSMYCTAQDNLHDFILYLMQYRYLQESGIGFNLAAYMDSPAIVKAPLSSIFGSALMPLLDDDTIDTY